MDARPTEPPSATPSVADKARAALEMLRATMHEQHIANVASYHVALVEASIGSGGAKVFRVWFRYQRELRALLYRDFGAWNGSGSNLGALMVPREGRHAERSSAEVSSELMTRLLEHFPVVIWKVRNTTRIERSDARLRYVPSDALEAMDSPRQVKDARLREALGAPAEAGLQVLCPAPGDFSTTHFEALGGSALPHDFLTRYSALLVRVIETRQSWYACVQVRDLRLRPISAEELPAMIRAFRDAFELARRPVSQPVVRREHSHASPVQHERQEHYRNVKGKLIKISKTVVNGRKGQSHAASA